MPTAPQASTPVLSYVPDLTNSLLAELVTQILTKLSQKTGGML